MKTDLDGAGQSRIAELKETIAHHERRLRCLSYGRIPEVGFPFGCGITAHVS
jgi:hypothetical protein